VDLAGISPSALQAGSSPYSAPCAGPDSRSHEERKCLVYILRCQIKNKCLVLTLQACAQSAGPSGTPGAGMQATCALAHGRCWHGATWVCWRARVSLGCQRFGTLARRWRIGGLVHCRRVAGMSARYLQLCVLALRCIAGTLARWCVGASARRRDGACACVLACGARVAECIGVTDRVC
jgi:hypothetical protein